MSFIKIFFFNLVRLFTALVTAFILLYSFIFYTLYAFIGVSAIGVIIISIIEYTEKEKT